MPGSSSKAAHRDDRDAPLTDRRSGSFEPQWRQKNCVNHCAPGTLKEASSDAPRVKRRPLDRHDQVARMRRRAPLAAAAAVAAARRHGIRLEHERDAPAQAAPARAAGRILRRAGRVHGSVEAGREARVLRQPVPDLPPGRLRAGEDVHRGPHAGIAVEIAEREGRRGPRYAGTGHDRAAAPTERALEAGRRLVARDRVLPAQPAHPGRRRRCA